MRNCFTVIVMLLAVTSFSQKVPATINFTKGQRLEVTTNMNLSTESMMGSSSGNVIGVEEYTVGEVNEGQTWLQKSMKKSKMNFSLMGQEITVDSDNKKDMEGQFGEPIKKLMEQKFEFAVDGRGKVVTVKTDPSKKKNEDGGNAMMGMMMPGMNSGSAIPTVGAASVFKYLPDGKEVSKGDSWTDSVNTAGNQSKTFYQVTDITEGEVLLNFKQESTIKSTQEAMGMNMDVSAVSTSSGTVTLDRITGILKQKTAVTTTESSINMGGREISSTMKITAVTTVATL